MANKNDKYEKNVNGKYYVDSQCIDCDLCREIAPNNFKRDDEVGSSIVYKQPVDEDEVKQCQIALSDCHVEAIGNDGD